MMDGASVKKYRHGKNWLILAVTVSFFAYSAGFFPPSLQKMTDSWSDAIAQQEIYQFATLGTILLTLM